MATGAKSVFVFPHLVEKTRDLSLSGGKGGSSGGETAFPVYGVRGFRAVALNYRNDHINVAVRPLEEALEDLGL